MTEQNLSFIGLMKRAGALIPGADGIYDAARAGSLIRLILLASDAGPNTKKGLLNAKDECGAPMIELDATKAQLGAILGQKECAAAARISVITVICAHELTYITVLHESLESWKICLPKIL